MLFTIKSANELGVGKNQTDEYKKCMGHIKSKKAPCEEYLADIL